MADALKRCASFIRLQFVSYGELLALLALGIGVRAYRLGAQSVWLDEFFSAAYVDRPSLLACLRDQRPENWEMVPFYYSLQYYWAQWIGPSAVSLRWLSILFSIAGVWLVYKLGREFFGRWCGFVAGLCLALSPIQIFHAQGIRPYALAVLLAIVSMYAFLRFDQTSRKRWWWANVGANMLLLWTHLFTGLLFIPQGAYLALLRVKKPLRLVAWVAAHAAILTPVLLWVSSIRVVPDSDGPGPSVSELRTMLFNQESLLRQGPLRMFATRESEFLRWTIALPDKTIEVTLPPIVRKAIDYLTVSEHALTYLLALALIWLALWLLWVALCWLKRSMRPQSEESAQPDTVGGALEPQSPNVSVRPVLLLILWYFLPVLALFALARFWKPHAFQSRYVLIALPGLYLMAGAAVQHMRWTLPRAAFTGLLLTAWGYQAALSMALPVRTDYLGAGEFIKEHATEADIVIVPDYNIKRVLAFNMRPTPIQLVRNEYPVELWDFIDTSLASQKTVWVVLNSDSEQRALAGRLQDVLAQKGIPYTKTAFLGMQNLYVYRCPGNRSAT